MEIIIGKTSGFCFGVSNAVNKTEELLKTQKNISCLGELVHNKQVTDDLISKGLTIISNIEEAKQNVIIRAHGVTNETYDKAKKLNLDVLDLTCPKVLKIHNIAEEYSNKGYYIFLIGQKEHPEVIGTMSYCGKNAKVIEKREEIHENIKKFYDANINKLLILAQTTFSMEKFNDIVTELKEQLSNNEIEIEVKKTICDATRLRQEETRKIAKMVNIMIIIGGKNSSNTNKLYQISKQYCNNSILIETKDELDIEHIKKFQKIGIVAGASTSQKSIDSVVEMLN